MKSLSAIVLFLCFSSTASAQDSYLRVIEDYYRVNPFGGNFPAFVRTLSNDTALIDKRIYKQTDTTGYMVRGNYRVFNPFSINANKVDVEFYESDFKLSANAIIRIYNYRLTAFFTDTEATRNAIKRDYLKLKRKLKKTYFTTSHTDLKGYNNIEDGEITAFIEGNDALKLEPAIISWQTLSTSKQVAITIITRYQRTENFLAPLGFNLLRNNTFTNNGEWPLGGVYD